MDYTEFLAATLDQKIYMQRDIGIFFCFWCSLCFHFDVYGYLGLFMKWFMLCVLTFFAVIGYKCLFQCASPCLWELKKERQDKSYLDTEKSSQSYYRSLNSRTGRSKGSQLAEWI